MGDIFQGYPGFFPRIKSAASHLLVSPSKCGFKWFYPLVNIQKAIENGHL
jgi:hypothetical protein